MKHALAYLSLSLLVLADREVPGRQNRPQGQIPGLVVQVDRHRAIDVFSDDDGARGIRGERRDNVPDPGSLIRHRDPRRM